MVTTDPRQKPEAEVIAETARLAAGEQRAQPVAAHVEPRKPGPFQASGRQG